MRNFLVGSFVILSSFLAAQESLTTVVDKVRTGYQSDYFRYPLEIAPRLNANFGEMRPNHFHMGLDLYTVKRENLNVYAAADGFISRVKIEAGGFGNAIYIDHPNGFTTLYAHMNRFFKSLDEHIKSEQYKLKTWAIDLRFTPDLFPVRKGDIIGLSGNTGASEGPHVHFEIRETKTEKCINPLLFDFKIPDNVAPDIFSLAFYDRNKSIYEQMPVIVPVIGIKNSRYVKVPELPFSNVGIAVKGSDRMSGSSNPNGIFSAMLFEKNKLISGFSMEKIGYDETRYLNAHIDHMHTVRGGGYFQQLFQLYGDKSSIYTGEQRINGFSLKDGKVHEMLLHVEDAAGNISKLGFSIKGGGVGKFSISTKSFGMLMLPDQINVFDTDSIELYIPEGSFYDSIHFTVQSKTSNERSAYSKTFLVHDPSVPLHKYFDIRIKPDKVIPYHLRDRMLIRKVTQTNVSVKKANWAMGKYGAAFRDFGAFELIADDNVPVITGPPDGINLVNASQLVIQVNDDHKLVKNFRAELDGKWLRFVQRGTRFTYVFDEKCNPGEHELKIFVEDEAGNPAEKIIHFKR